MKNIKARNWHVVILCILLLIVDMSFLFLTLSLNILPAIYNTVVILMLALLTVLALILLASSREKRGKRRAGIILSVIMIILMVIGCFYLANTYSAFSRMSDDDKQYEEFYVVALKDGRYKRVGDIEKETVYVHKGASKTYEEAQGILKSEVDVRLEAVEGYMELKSIIIGDDGQKNDRLIFLSSNNYELICEETEGFEKNTKIIHTVSVEIEGNDIAKRVGITEQPFNVYISGIDTFGGINKVSRSDVNMIMTVDPVDKEILLTSIPRDMYVTLHSYGALDKLTHSGIYGIGETVQTVEDWLGMDINYYIRVNFTSLQDIVDAIGGIDVTSEYAFETHGRQNRGYSFTEGENHLDGAAALAFARERKSFEEGDQERIKNQQRVLKGIIDKITGSTAILTGYTGIMNSVGNEIQTNMSEKDIAALVRMQLEDLGGWNIKMISITGSGANASTYSMGTRQLYVVIPDEASVKAAQEAINKVQEQ